MPVNNPFALTFSGNITQWDGTNLGQPTVWGTPATGQTVIGVNAELFAGSNALSSTGGSLNVNITGGSSSGTQYVDGTAETAGAFTGTVAMGYNGTEVVGLRLDSSNNLLVAVPGTLTVTGTVGVTQSTSPWVVSGTVTANAGSGIFAQNLVQVAGSAVATAAAGIAKVGLTDGIGNAITSTSNALDVNIASSGVTITVSGTVTANQGGAPWSQNLTEVGGVAVSLGQAVSASSFPVVIASDQSPLPVTQSGSWTVSIAGQPISVSQSGTWNVNQTIGVAGFEKITDGTNTAAVKAASTSPVPTDPALVVSISPNSAAITADSAGTGTSNAAAAVWTSSTSNNTTVAIYNTNFSYNTA